jgi:hypothetical protein
MNCLESVVLTMMLLLLVRLLLLVLVLVVMMLTPPTPTVSSALEFALFSLATASDEQYESIPDNEIALLVRKFCSWHKFYKERRRSPRGCFECGDTTYFIANCPKRRKLDSSNKYDYVKRNDYSKDDDKKKHRFGDNRKKKF